MYSRQQNRICIITHLQFSRTIQTCVGHVRGNYVAYLISTFTAPWLVCPSYRVIHMCDMTHSTCAMTHINVCRVCVMCVVTTWHTSFLLSLRHGSVVQVKELSLGVTWRIHTCVMTQINVCHAWSCVVSTWHTSFLLLLRHALFVQITESFICVTRHIHPCAMTHIYVCHASFDHFTD